jgi:hypothetical protein
MLMLPPPGDYAVGMIFLPSDAERRAECERLVEATFLLERECLEPSEDTFVLRGFS